jgi:hypothetical protein
MAFSRATSPELTPAPDELTARMVGIGMNFAAKAEPDADIEGTLLHASVLGMDEGDLRVLAVLTTWLGMHHTCRRPLSEIATRTSSRRVRRHAGYRNRVLMGPSFRADVWTALEQSPDLSIADIARKASCSRVRST